MFQHILIATDGSERSREALFHGVALASALRSRLTVLTVTRPWDPGLLGEKALVTEMHDYEHEAVRLADRRLDEAVGMAQGVGEQCERVHARHDKAWRAIVDEAKSRDCDLIIMASHGRSGASALLLGSETQKVLTHSTVPVLVYR